MQTIARNPDRKTSSLAIRRMEQLLSTELAFDLVMPGMPGREAAEQQVVRQFHSNYGASISDFMPQLFTMSGQNNLCAVAGFRPALGEELFLEQYLRQSIENTLGSVAGRTVNRADIVEIGNLVATRRGASQLFFLILGAVLQRANYRWIVFTATPQVIKSVERFGFRLHTLGDADPSLLRHTTPSSWGSYYQYQPRVVAGRLAQVTVVRKQRGINARMMTLFENSIAALASTMSDFTADGTYARTA